jgi:outer membrane protein assembly factor BamB
MAVIFGSPVYVDGLVLAPVASFELMTGGAAPTFRGHLVALDPETGEEVWRWWATEADDTAGPGVSLWSSPAVDAADRHLEPDRRRRRDRWAVGGLQGDCDG